MKLSWEVWNNSVWQTWQFKVGFIRELQKGAEQSLAGAPAWSHSFKRWERPRIFIEGILTPTCIKNSAESYLVCQETISRDYDYITSFINKRLGNKTGKLVVVGGIVELFMPGLSSVYVLVSNKSWRKIRAACGASH